MIFGFLLRNLYRCQDFGDLLPCEKMDRSRVLATRMHGYAGGLSLSALALDL